MLRSIIHLDADAFFAAVEQAADARLRGKPMAVGGESRGVIASASYEARKFGIKSAMPTSRARKLCPKLIIVPGDFEKYERFSNWMFEYAYDFTPTVEVASIDEGFFDVSASRKPALEIAETIQRAIRERLKITVSEGIAANKLVSQIASKLKKPCAFQHIPAGREISFLHPLPNFWMPGLGPKISQQFYAAGLARVGQIANTPTEMLSLLVGNYAPTLKNYANAIDERPVVPVHFPQKSYSQQETFSTDQTDEDYLAAVLRKMTDSLMAKVREDSKSIRTLTVKVRYNDMGEDQRSESLAEPTDLESDVYSKLLPMLRQAWKRRVSLRLVSLKFSNVYEGLSRVELAIDVQSKQREQRRILAKTLDDVRERLGENVIMRGHNLLLRDWKREKEPLRVQKSAVNHRRSLVPPLSSRIATFAPLNVRSFYSFLDSTLSIEDIVRLAKENRCPAVALTDPNLHGAVEFYAAAKDAGIKPIIGAQVVIGGIPFSVYVQNGKGYSNLSKLLSRSNDDLLEEQPDTTGLIGIGSDIRGRGLFQGRFYLGFSDLEQLRRAPVDCPKVFAPAIHYAVAADRWKWDVVQSIRTQTLLKQEHPAKQLGGVHHFQPLKELRELTEKCPELFTNSLRIAEDCSFDFSLGKPLFPNFFPRDGSSASQFLRKLVLASMKRRYSNNEERVRKQIEEELTIISEVGYEEYFLVVWDLLQQCKERGIEWITRGSAADSLVCYSLGISDVCPIRFDLYFRRFLNKERMALNKLPDIDIDFPHDRKDDVVDLIFAKYGSTHAAIVGGFSTFQARSALGDVAKVLGVSEYQIRRITEHLPYHLQPSLIDEAVKQPMECRDLPLNEEPYSTALQMAQFLDGFPRHPKMHPCGVVIARQPIHELVPTFTSNKSYPTTHFDMDSVEAVGLVKMDILAQGGLAVMRDTKAALAKRGIAVDLSNVDEKDEGIWDMISAGGARGVHHIESPAMLSLSRNCNVRDLDTLVGIVSVIRPGAANQSKKQEFTRRYQGLSPIVYPHPSLEPALRCSFGLVVYEEQILPICEAFAGLPPGRADVLRRALSKEKESTVAEIKQEFHAAALRLGRAMEDIQNVWNLVDGFRGYAFCKAHSAAYGVEALQSAWLKCNYPAETMAAILTNGKGFYPALVYVIECHRLGIPILPPTINEPGPQFQVVQGDKPRILVPVTYTLGLSETMKEALMLERQRGVFGSMDDFYLRVRPTREEFDAMSRAGAFDEFGETRTRQFWRIRMLTDSQDAGAREQGWLFPAFDSNRLHCVPTEEPTFQQRLEWENELFGFPASGHPLDLYPQIAWDTYCPVSRMDQFMGQEITTCGLIVEGRTYHQSDGDPMKFLSISDYSGIVETELFAKTYKSYGLATVRYPVLELTGKVEPYENGRGFSLRVLRAGKARIKQ